MGDEMSELVKRLLEMSAWPGPDHYVPPPARDLMREASDRIEELEDALATELLNDPVLRWSHLGKDLDNPANDMVAPDGSEWRNIRIGDGDYTIPYEVSMHLVKLHEREAAL